jgi:hypothetical protein
MNDASFWGARASRTPCLASRQTHLGLAVRAGTDLCRGAARDAPPGERDGRVPQTVWHSPQIHRKQRRTEQKRGKGLNRGMGNGFWPLSIRPLAFRSLVAYLRMGWPGRPGYRRRMAGNGGFARRSRYFFASASVAPIWLYGDFVRITT